MKAGPLTLNQLFDATVCYTVPLFQRGYVWDAERQWQPLWSDVQVQADALFTDTQPPEHFLGAVVLDQMRTRTGKTPRRQVIDGQQRLTTLQLLLAAARDRLRHFGEDRTADAVHKLIRNDVPLAETEDEEFKVWPTNVDRAAFRFAVTAGSSQDARRQWEQHHTGDEDDRPSDRILEAYSFFENVISEWLSHFDADKLDKATRALYGALHSQMVVVSIDLDQGDDPQAIFETLNDRATPLTASDLVKNLLFRTMDGASQDLQALYRDHWEPFESQWWRAEQTQGRYKRKRLDIFLSHYLTWRLEQDVTVAELYSRYRGMIHSSDDGPVEHLRDLARAGRLYRSMLDEPFQTPEGQFFYRLRVMATSTAMPLLLQLYSELEDGTVSREQLRGCLRVLDSYLVRRLLCRLTTKNYNRIFLQALRSIRERQDRPVNQALTDFLADLDETSGVWPDDTQLRNTMMHDRHYGNIKAERLRVVFEALEAQMRDHFTEPVSFERPPTLEHLLPRKWQEHWPVSNNAEALERRRQAVDNIGNLTLLTQPLNSKVSHGPWSEKRQAILQHSALTLNRGLPTEWNEDLIAERCEALIGAACTAWPGPDATTELRPHA